MKNHKPTIINRQKKVVRSVNDENIQNGKKKVTKVKRGCCLRGILKG